ncbi:MAG: energy transducer TonB [Ignavibacteriaceae bacterium]|nr:energy transducer TonB [Ignavibacteriaceae bacterium]
MPNFKSPKADLRSKYKKVLEISIVLSLAFMVLAFKFFPDFTVEAAQFEAPQDLLTVEDIQQTKQENRPPPPPKPPIPIEAPSDNALDDIELSDTDLDETEVINEPPPPPKEETTTKKVVEEEPVYFVAVEDMPEPIGGIGAIQSKIVYPEIAKRAGVEGRVYVLAFVDEQGDVTKAQVIKGIGAGCDEAALEAVKKTKFKPGKQRGKPVKVQVSIPVMFRLQ